MQIEFFCHLITLTNLISMAFLRYSSLRSLVSRWPSRSFTVNSGKSYNHKTIENKWQRFWEDKKIFTTRRRPGKAKKYVLDMFPYPSGSGLHVGHPEGYTATDIMARYWRMKDYDVLHPMGWDSFGLPAEQHAINTGTHPAVTTNVNIETFKRQLKSLGFSYDWEREIATTDDEYIRWTQWIFLKLFKAGLAEQTEATVNWCPALGTVLANEEIINGLSERGSHPVVRHPLRQWTLKITNYARKLEDGLQLVDWPEGTVSSQKQWIGKSTGATIRFPIYSGATENASAFVEVFTTRPDTLFGVTYVVLAPENPLVNSLTTLENKESVAAYCSSVASKTDLERTATGGEKAKTGVFTGSFVLHPLSGERLPVWVADYVLYGYGSGAVMAVPAHDERDFEFAKKFDLPIRQVVQPDASQVDAALPYTDVDGVLTNSGSLDGLKFEEAKAKIVQMLEQVGRGKETISFKLRDWLFSRQRYWGEPIPIYFPVKMLDTDSESSGVGDPRSGPHQICFDQPIPVSESELPLKLPPLVDFQPGTDPQGCLARAVDWRYFQKDGKWYARETNTMPQWAGSCWYYLRFADPKHDDPNSQRLLSSEASTWLPVDLYVGGQEHAVLHLLYARFWHRALHDLGYVDHPEPFLKLVHQGMILGSDGEKMSKSRGNVVNPDDVVDEHGADALRLYEMFMGPLEAVKPWQTSQLIGVVRFRDKVFNCVSGRSHSDDPPDEALLKEMHKTTKKVTEDIEAMRFNTAISSLMIFTNTLHALNASMPVPRICLETLVLLLSPMAPHVAEECWELLGHKESLAYHPWPKFEESLCHDDSAKIAVQVNSKVRGEVEIGLNFSQEQAFEVGRKHKNVMRYLDGKKVKKIIYVPGKILNVIVT